MDGRQQNTLARVVTWLIVGLVVVLLVRLLFPLIRATFAIAWWLFVLILIGFVTMTLVEWYRRRRRDG